MRRLFFVYIGNIIFGYALFSEHFCYQFRDWLEGQIQHQTATRLSTPTDSAHIVTILGYPTSRFAQLG